MFGLLGAIYLLDLGRTPVRFGGAEAHFAVGGHIQRSMTTTLALTADHWRIERVISDADNRPAARFFSRKPVIAAAPFPLA